MVTIAHLLRPGEPAPFTNQLEPTSRDAAALRKAAL